MHRHPTTKKNEQNVTWAPLAVTCWIKHTQQCLQGFDSTQIAKFLGAHNIAVFIKLSLNPWIKTTTQRKIQLPVSSMWFFGVSDSFECQFVFEQSDHMQIQEGHFEGSDLNFAESLLGLLLLISQGCRREFFPALGRLPHRSVGRSSNNYGDTPGWTPSQNGAGAPKCPSRWCFSQGLVRENLLDWFQICKK